MINDLVGYGIGVNTATNIVNLINAGLTVGSIVSIVGGASVGLAGMFNAVKAAIAKKGIRRAVSL